MPFFIVALALAVGLIIFLALELEDAKSDLNRIRSRYGYLLDDYRELVLSSSGGVVHRTLEINNEETHLEL